MAKSVRDSGDGDASILDTSIGISGLFPLESSSVQLGAPADCCGMPDMVAVSTTDGTEARDVSGIMCDVGEPAVGMVPGSDTTPLAVSSEVVVSAGVVSDRS